MLKKLRRVPVRYRTPAGETVPVVKWNFRSNELTDLVAMFLILTNLISAINLLVYNKKVSLCPRPKTPPPPLHFPLTVFFSIHYLLLCMFPPITKVHFYFSALVHVFFVFFLLLVPFTCNNYYSLQRYFLFMCKIIQSNINISWNLSNTGVQNTAFFGVFHYTY